MVMSPRTCPYMLSYYAGFLEEKKSLNHRNHQWCSGPRMRIYVWIGYIISFMSVIWGMGNAWQGSITPQTTWSPTKPQTCSAVTLLVGTKSLDHGPHQLCSGPTWGHLYGYDISLFMRVLWGMDYVWQGWITPQITIWLPTTPQICSDVMKGFLAKSLNYRPCQWCSGQMMMIPVWTCYPTVIWVVYMRQGAMSDRGGPPHRPQYDFQLHPGHAQLLPWILEQGAWNIPVL